MKHLKITLFALLLASTCTFAQTKPKVKAKPKTHTQQPAKIAVPSFNDIYSKYVKHIEEGNTNINYEEFRTSYIYSEQFKVASEKSQEYNRLKTLLTEQLNKNKFADVIITAKQILSIDYTNLFGQRALAAAYIETGDTKNAEKYTAIKNGLLNSIITRGNGLSCESAWPVIQEEEEYFVLQNLGYGIESFDVFTTGGVCHEFRTIMDSKRKNIYFEVSRLEEGRKILTPVVQE